MEPMVMSHPVPVAMEFAAALFQLVVYTALLIYLVVFLIRERGK